MNQLGRPNYTINTAISPAKENLGTDTKHITQAGQKLEDTKLKVNDSLLKKRTIEADSQQPATKQRKIILQADTTQATNLISAPELVQTQTINPKTKPTIEPKPGPAINPEPAINPKTASNEGPKSKRKLSKQTEPKTAPNEEPKSKRKLSKQTEPKTAPNEEQINTPNDEQPQGTNGSQPNNYQDDFDDLTPIHSNDEPAANTVKNAQTFRRKSSNQTEPKTAPNEEQINTPNDEQPQGTNGSQPNNYQDDFDDPTPIHSNDEPADTVKDGGKKPETKKLSDKKPSGEAAGKFKFEARTEYQKQLTNFTKNNPGEKLDNTALENIAKSAIEKARPYQPKGLEYTSSLELMQAIKDDKTLRREPQQQNYK